MATLALCGITAGCSPAVPQDVIVRWLLADGRSCVDAAVISVTIVANDPSAQDTGSITPSLCPATPNIDGRVTIPALTPGVQLAGRGVSSSNSVLYRGALTIPSPVPPTLDLVLYFTGGR